MERHCDPYVPSRGEGKAPQKLHAPTRKRLRNPPTHCSSDDQWCSTLRAMESNHASYQTTSTEASQLLPGTDRDRNMTQCVLHLPPRNQLHRTWCLLMLSSCSRFSKFFTGRAPPRTRRGLRGVRGERERSEMMRVPSAEFWSELLSGAPGLHLVRSFAVSMCAVRVIMHGGRVFIRSRSSHSV